VHGERKKALDVVERGQTISLLGEGSRERVVKTKAVLNAMTQTGENWHETGVSYRMLELAGGVWIVRIPSREGGDDMWVKASRVDAPTQLNTFFKGDEKSPGPARVFKNNGQSKPVPFQLPNQFKDTAEYEVVDIGRFKTEVTGVEDICADGDMFPFVTALKQDGSGILMYLDSRKDMARGTGGLFKGEVFEPEVDIKSLL
jgi:hypothetical protein